MAGGTLLYNSIQAGFGGQRMASDDLESVGWVILRCVLGTLPWAGSGVTSSHDKHQWQRRSEGISIAKELFLEDPSVYGVDFNYCPQWLRQYIRDCQSIDSSVSKDGCSQLLPHFESPVEHWRRFADVYRHSTRGGSRRGVLDPYGTSYVAVRGLLVWRPANAADSEDLQERVDVECGLVVRSTGVTRTDPKGDAWVQVDPVWMPWNPRALAAQNWLLEVSPIDSMGPLLVPRSYQQTGPMKLLAEQRDG